MSNITFNKIKKTQTNQEYINDCNQRKYYSNLIAQKLQNAINEENENLNSLNYSQKSNGLSEQYKKNIEVDYNDVDFNGKYQKQVKSLLGCCDRFFVEKWHSDNLDDTKRKQKPFRTCKNKFCAICCKIRSNKLFYDTYNVIDYIKKNDVVEFVPYHLTLTIKNPTYEKFKHYYDVMNSAIHNMLDKNQRSKVYKLNKYVEGWQCAREISQSEAAKNAGELHPHLHILLLLKPSFLNKNKKPLLSKAKILAEWNNALKANDANFPKCSEIKLVKVKQNDLKNGVDNEANAIAEVSKYPTKPADLIKMDDAILLDLLKNLYGARMVTFGGVIKDIRKLLKISDEGVVDVFINENEYKLIDVKLYNFIDNVYKKQNIRKKDILEFRLLASSELTELNYSADKEKVSKRSEAVQNWQYLDYTNINKIQEIAKYKDLENIKDSDTAKIFSKILILADEDYKKSKEIKYFEKMQNYINVVLYNQLIFYKLNF
jgi:hypothetical protein